MKRTRSAGGLAVLTLIIAVVLAGGCKPKKYTVSTRIDANGEFDREILQPLDDSLPQEALSARKTIPPGSQPSDYALDAGWRKQWRQCTTRPAAQDAEGTYVSATGHFAVADEIPQNYQLIAYPFADRTASNQITHTFDDCLLFGVDTWNETLAETLTLPDYADAVDEMLCGLLPAANAALDDVLGREYDLAALHDYLDKDLRKVLRHLYLWCYENGPGINADGLSGEPVRALRQILAGADFKLPVAEGGAAVDQDQFSTAWEPFVRDRIRKLVRLKGSESPLTEEQVKALVDRLGLFNDSKSSPGTQPSPQQESKELEAFRLAFSRYFDRNNKMPLEQAFPRWEARIGGAHQINPLMPTALHEVAGSRHYSYSFTAGGPILETNGQRVADDQVQWEFTDLDIWPRGYAMQLTAVRWNREAEKKLFGKVVLHDIDTVLHLRDLIADHDEVYEALAQAIEQGDLHPIKALSESKEPVDREAAKTILDLMPKSRK